MLIELVEEIKSVYPLLINPKFNLEEVTEALFDLNNLIEMDNIKEMVSDIVKAHLFSLVNKKTFNNNFHNILCGPPGIGKTTVAKKIARIFKSFNLIEQKKTEHLIKYRHHIEQLYEHYNNQKVLPNNILKHYWKSIRDALDNNFEDSDEIIICGREDLIAGFSGQSALKTLEFLIRHRGKCVIIEEAYLLWTGENDGYGMEALTVLNRFMEEFKNDIIIIMTGYKELISSTIFKAQPGLKRRFQWYFELQPYSPKGLKDMFILQMRNDGWFLEDALLLELENFFTEKIDYFPHFGGDTERFAWVCKAVHASSELLNYFQILRTNGDLPVIYLTLENFHVSFEKYQMISSF